MDATSSDGLDVALDIMGQQPLLRIYTQLSFCFARSDTHDDEAVKATLTAGLERLTASFPWVAGQVVSEGAREGYSGTFSIKALDKIPRLTIKDLREDPSAPTITELREAKFPMSMLDEDAIAPRRTLPGDPKFSPTDPEPVMLVQANFIVGGLIITINAQHSTMDMTGQGEVIRLLSKACCGEDFTTEELEVGNMDRGSIIEFFDESYQPGAELDNQIVKTPSQPPKQDSSQPPESPPKSSWVYFSFSPESLRALKSEAVKTMAPGTKFVSTDDAISALIWQCTTRARVPRLELSEKCMFFRAVDVRQQMGVSKLYPGLCQNMTYNKETFQEILDQPLGVLASRLRSSLDPEEIRYHTRALATFLHRSPDKTICSITATANPSTDVMLSSWAKVDAWNWDFNLGLGKPEAVRRPRFMPFECLMYLMPRRPDGEISAALSLRDEDMERLKEDKEFTKYAEYIG